MSNYLVIRLTPSTAVDGATFATYLEDLQIQVFAANPPPGTTPVPLGKPVFSSPMVLFQEDPTQLLGMAQTYLALVSWQTSVPTPQANPSDYGKVLQFASTSGIPIGSWLFSAGTEIDFTSGFQVISVTEQSVTLSQALPKNVSTGTITSFILNYDNVTPWATDPPLLSFPKKTSDAAAQNATVLPFKSTTGIPLTTGISVGMAVLPQAGIIANDTTVIAADTTSVTLSQPLIGTLPKNTPVTFTFNLSTDIVQHIEPSTITISGFPFTVFGPASAATAIVELLAPPPTYLNVSVTASRDKEQIPIDTIFYNVLHTDTLPTANQYQAIPSDDTSFYITLPAPPINSQSISLALASDGTAPPFAALYTALQQVLAADPITTLADIGTNGLTADQCSRLAYEIVWSQLNALPTPPDPLDQLYTNPPDTGESSNSDEQDRQKFEGDLKSYYATRNAEAQRLTGYVYSLATALFCYQKSQDVTSVRFEFPIIDGNTTLTTINEAAVLLSTTSPTFTAPGFAVPAEYFYVLVAGLPPLSAPQPLQHYQMACLMNEQQVLDKLNSAISKGIITAPPPPSPSPADPHAPTISTNQAARNLAALAVLGNTDPECSLNPDIESLVQVWLSTSGDDTQIDAFWQGVVTTPGYLDLVLSLVTNNSQPLIDAIKASKASPTDTKALGISKVAALANLKIQDWETFFATDTNFKLLPAFTAPGPTNQSPPNAKALKAQADVFVRNLQSFFEVSAHSNPVPSVNPNVPPTLYREDPGQDPIQKFISAYSGFAFGLTLDPTQSVFQNALDAVFSNDPPARAWLEQTILAINAVYVLTNGIPQPLPPNTTGLPDLRFSAMEALYARGFISLQSVLALSPDDFQQALTGTIAYTYAPTIQKNAGTWQPGASQPGGFQPINPDGCLVNCIPPFYLSPLSPIAYLQEMLTVSQTSTCENLQPVDGRDTLGTLIATRRGNLGNLQATAANLETPLPRIDLVNECLEALVTTPGSTSGVTYTTASDKLDTYMLCTDDSHDDASKGHTETCHMPATLFETLPEYSSPATPVAQPGAYDTLRSDFSACCLPYSQSLDISRSYLHSLGTSRYATMRHFRKDITEFVLNPAEEPSDFQRQLLRYPMRIEVAREYLGITPEEYDLLFTQNIVTTPTGNQLLLWQLYGFASAEIGASRETRPHSWTLVIVELPEFLKRTCLTYCEFIELWQAGFVQFRRSGEGTNGTFPACEPCCLDEYVVEFEQPQDPNDALRRLIVFIRLWHKLHEVSGAKYTFAQLRDICDVLHLFNNDGTINPDFIRQLAAFQMLRDDCGLQLSDGSQNPTSAIDDQRTHILALWIGSGAPKWNWAISHLLERIQHYARTRHQCGNRQAHFIKLLAENLDPLSLLAGFDPSQTANTWHALPTHTLRFADVLSKIYASDFSIGELLFLFTAEPHLDGDDPFPLQDANEALDFPLALPDDQDEHSLWALRHKLLAVHNSGEETEKWTWRHIESSLHHEFGYEPTASSDPLLSLGEHFFPEVLSACGNYVDMKRRQYRVPLAAASTDAAMWNTPDSPFRYDASTQELWIRLPLLDKEVFEKLSQIRQLKPEEQVAVQSLYFAPRLDLAAFAFIFSNFGATVEHLIQEDDEKKRWDHFQREFARCHARCQVIATHLAHHVAAATDQEHPDGVKLAWRLLQHLFADENRATSSWETDDGQVPAVTWPNQPNGGAFAALLDLTGTGLLGEFTPENSNLTWREVRGPMNAFGHEKNHWNIPVPTLQPSMGLNLTPTQAHFAGIRNGIALKGQNGESLGSPQGFDAHWQGLLLVEHEGAYEFYAGAPTPDGEKPNFESVERRRWCVTLKRGQKTWVVLSHHWPHTQAPAAHTAPLTLRRGAYQIMVEFAQPEAVFTHAETCAQHTGFQVKYCGPDSEDRLIPIPLDHLYRNEEDGTLGNDIDRSGTAYTFLNLHFTSTLRGMRRTYQRAYKALLFAHRFGLSAKTSAEYGQSEIGYMLTHPDRFEGTAYYQPAGNTSFSTHHAYFDFNFLPLLDNYYAPSPAEDLRVLPGIQRRQALFDWWERIFDYVQMREETRRVREHPLWLLFDEAAEKQPDDPTQLLRHIGVEPDHSALVTLYYSGYNVSSDDLQDERWAIRVWRAEKWLRELLYHFAAKDITTARPDLWVSDDLNVVEASDAQSGNANLTQFVYAGCFGQGAPRRYKDVKRLNDGLREHARRALLAYLCGMDRVQLPQGGYAQEADDLSALLLLDVETGLCEKASRIEDAISAVQTYVQRCRLGLEGNITIPVAFTLLWERRFASFRIWQAYKRREIYRENWIDWEEIQKAQQTEAFRFLEAELQKTLLSAPRPGGLEYWSDQQFPAHPALTLIQSHEPDQLQQFSMSSKQPEGFNLLGTQERDARPSWLAALQLSPSSQTGSSDGGNTNPNQGNSDPKDNAVPTSIVLPPSQSDTTPTLPLWIQAAIRLGVRFLRVAAAGEPPAATRFAPWHTEGEAGCCCECGKQHPAVVDEYYFWLLDSRYYDDLNNPLSSDDPTPPQDATWDWEDPTLQPTLLHWDSKPMVQLAWCRVHHNGEFQQPRRSIEGVPLDGTTPPELQLLGRSDDSLTFLVLGGIPPDQAPGFRYDLATDAVVTLPLVVPQPGTGAKYPAGLSAYPFFAYFAPGASIMPPSLFSPALAVAGALRTSCHFEAALKWYTLAFNPLQDDCSWCPQISQDTSTDDTTRQLTNTRPLSESTATDRANAECCLNECVSDQVAQNRSITLHYLETLHQWGDALMRRNSPEALQQARLIVETEAYILGARPRSVMTDTMSNEPQKEPPTVLNFQPACAPLNPRLLALYDLVDDRLALIHACLDARRLKEGNRDRSYWGNSDLRNGWQTAADPCVDGENECCPHSPYRFTFLIQKAQELAGHVKELGSALLTAFEKVDAEYLASLHELHERHLLDLTLEIRQNQSRESDWQVQALQKTQEGSQARRQYNALLIQSGLISGEVQHEMLTDVTLSDQEAGRVMEGIGAIMGLIPDINVGMSNFVTTPLGSKLQGVFSAMSQISNSQAGSASTTGGLRLTQAGWDRRTAEWRQQVQVLDIENDQIERQLLAAERRRAIALRELNNHQQQMEHAAEVQDFLRDKFANHALYLYLQQETAALFSRMYELARCTAQQAQRAFNYERGHTVRRFLPTEIWDNLHEGLLAGERLQLALQHMEKAYLDENVREYELTKHFSLRMHFPLEFLRLKETGYCEIDIPEWMFDLDYPGQYMRRIKNMTLTIPCVVGPYTGIHCRLTLLSSTTRVHPRLSKPAERCCDDDDEPNNGYQAWPNDPRVVTEYAAREAIATSGGQNDSGLFELNFRDERYTPFEFEGAISRWCIELPQENNQFDIDSVTDIILHLNYTAREGGEILRRAANEVAQRHLPGDGVRYFNIRHEFPDAWHRFQGSFKHEEAPKHLGIRFSRDMFPFIPGHRELWIKRLDIFFEAPDAEPSKHKVVKFLIERQDRYRDENQDEREIREITCIASEEWSYLYHGVLDIQLGPLAQRAEHDLGTFQFPMDTGVISHAFLLCSYDVAQKHSNERRIKPEWHR